MKQRHRAPACSVPVSATRRSAWSRDPESFAGLKMLRAEDEQGYPARAWVLKETAFPPVGLALGAEEMQVPSTPNFLFLF